MLWIRSTELQGEHRNKNWARGYKNCFMLNSAEHEILNAHKYKKISIFYDHISLECYFTC